MAAELANPGGYGGIPKDGHSFDPWRDLLEHLEPFPALAIFEHEEPGGVAARARQARNETGPDRVDDDHEHDRYGGGRLQQRRHGRSARTTHDCVRRECGQFHRVLANVVGIGPRPAGVDPHVAAVDPTERRQALLQRPDAG